MRHGRLVVVEDDRSSRDALCRLLERYDYEVTGVADGPQLLELVGRQACDLILLDVELPGMNGLEVLTRIRNLTTPQAALPIIMVTCRTDDVDIVKAFELGANDYVTKPIDIPVALARIGTHVAHKRAVERVRESEERYALAVQGANDGLWDWNLATNEVYWSTRWKEMVGCGPGEVGTGLDEWLRRVHPDDLEAVRRGLDAHLATGGGHYESEHRLQHRNGAFRWVLCRGAAVRNTAGAATRLAGSFTDITGAKLADRLTGLPNRLLFVDLLHRALARSRRLHEYRFAVLVLGLDRFTTVSDSLGHDTANRLLMAVAARLQSDGCTGAAADGDRPMALARLGEDEFAALVDVGAPNEAVRAAERLRAALERPFELDGQQIFIAPKVGVALGGTRYVDAEEVLRDATIALNRAKADGGTWCELFDPDMRRLAVARLQLESDLRQAIRTRAFRLHYQPIVSLGTGRITGFEALVRWRHPERGPLSPAEFIAVAEDAGLILPLGSLVLTEACRQMVSWQRCLGSKAPAMISVNVSSLQFADAGFAGDLEAILAKTGLDPKHLKLELTESALPGDVPIAREMLDRIRTLGIRFSLDDFGTGYSSLSYLHQLPIDTLKIDRSFVSRIGFEEHGAVMARAIVALAQSLGMDVVAEGVETEAQLTKLQVLGCEYAQGFYFSRPVEKGEAGRLARAQPWAPVQERLSRGAGSRRSVA